jgi:hypothetical protein
MFEDLDWKERKEYEAEMNKEGVSIYTDFVKHEMRDDKLIYTYACSCCAPAGETIEHEREMPIERDYLYIGSAPSEEDCVFPSVLGCKALILQLRNTYGNEPEGAQLVAKYEAGEDGYEVMCYFDTQHPMSMAYAYMIEGNLPEKWSQAAKDYIAKYKGGN